LYLFILVIWSSRTARRNQKKFMPWCTGTLCCRGRHPHTWNSAPVCAGKSADNSPKFSVKEFPKFLPIFPQYSRSYCCYSFDLTHVVNFNTSKTFRWMGDPQLLLFNYCAINCCYGQWKHKLEVCFTESENFSIQRCSRWSRVFGTCLASRIN
jgi:hypothetical protein